MSLDLQDVVGVFPGVPSIDYHSGIGLSFTGFKHFMKYPAKYRAYIDRPEDSTSSQIKGQLTHCMVLEPDQVDSRFKWIKGPKNKNPFKAEAEAAEAEGLIAVGNTDWVDAVGMAEAVMKHPEAAALIKHSQKEISAYAMDPEFGVMRKCRPDIWAPEMRVMADLKYVADATEDGFLMLLRRNKWHIQTAWYLQVFGWAIERPLENFVHICVEEKYPHGVGLHALDNASIERAIVTIRYHLAKYKHCLETDTWPGLPTGINTTALPSFMWADDEELSV